MMRPATIILFAVVCVAIPWLPPYGQHVVILVALYGALALAWNILGGMTGQMSLGHALYVGAGAYVSTVLFLKFGISPWLGLLAAVAAGGALGALLGFTVFRRRLSGVYFALVTLAIAEMALHVVSNWSFLGAANGLSIPSTPGVAAFQFSSKAAFCYVALGTVVIVSLVIWAIERSRLGYVFLTIRENESSAAALGIDVVQGKVIASAISGALAAMIGPIYANYVLFIDPESVFGVTLSIDALLFSFVGGLHAPLGPLLGAAVLVPLTEWLRGELTGHLAGLHLIIYGILLIGVMRLAPEGLAGLLSRLTGRRST